MPHPFAQRFVDLPVMDACAESFLLNQSPIGSTKRQFQLQDQSTKFQTQAFGLRFPEAYGVAFDLKHVVSRIDDTGHSRSSAYIVD